MIFANQQEIVRRVEALFALTDQIESRNKRDEPVAVPGVPHNNPAPPPIPCGGALHLTSGMSA